jgi:isocitrate/isopropylmalate dehydrogenase
MGNSGLISSVKFTAIIKKAFEEHSTPNNVFCIVHKENVIKIFFHVFLCLNFSSLQSAYRH